jgi:antigen 43
MSQIIVTGGTTSVTTVDASNTYHVEDGGTLDILYFGLVSGLITVGGDGRLIVSEDGTALSTTISNGGVQDVVNGGIAISSTISSGGYQGVGSGGIASDTTIATAVSRA